MSMPNDNKWQAYHLTDAVDLIDYHGRDTTESTSPLKSCFQLQKNNRKMAKKSQNSLVLFINQIAHYLN